MVHEKSDIRGEWLVKTPSQNERNHGVPELRISLAGDNWDEIKEAWANMLANVGKG